MKTASVPVYMFAGADEEQALTCVLRLWHRTAARHPIHVVCDASMPRLRQWVDEHSDRVRWVEVLTANSQTADCGVYLDARAEVPPGWLTLLLDGAQKNDCVLVGDCVMLLKNLSVLGDRNSALRSVEGVRSKIGGFFKKPRMVRVDFPTANIFDVGAVPASDHRILTVIHEASGGAVRTSEDLCRALAESGPWQPWLLRCGLFAWRLEWFGPDGQSHMVGDQDFPGRWQMDCDDPHRSNAYADLLGKVAPELVHVRHLLGSGAWLLRKTSDAAVPVIFSHHDYYAACPNVELLDATGACCFGACGRNFPPGNTQFPDCEPTRIWEMPRPPQRLRSTWRSSWTEDLADAFERCVAAHVTTSESAREILRATFPLLKDFHVIPHGRDIAGINPLATPPDNPPIGVLSIGHLTRSKGSEVLLQIARDNADAGHPLAIHHLGQAVNASELAACGVTVHGKYDRENIGSTLGNQRFSYGLLCQIWPETFSHTLTELWAFGLPVVASNLGAVAERINATGAGWVLDPANPAQWFPIFLQISQNPTAWSRVAAAAKNASSCNLSTMAASYGRLYEKFSTSIHR